MISPLLLCIYMDELLKRLEAEALGCWIGKHYYGGVGYADDLTLAVPSVRGLRQMLKICEEFGEEYSVEYDSTKTVCVLFSSRKIFHKPDIQLCGRTLKWVDHVKHLGNHLESNLSEVTEIRMKKSDIIQRVNTVVVSLGKSNDMIISKVFNSQCTHFYGAQAWRFRDKAVKEFQTMWNQCIRKLLTLPYETHRRFLPHLIGTPSASDQIFSRFLKMQLKMETSENHHVS